MVEKSTRLIVVILVAALLFSFIGPATTSKPAQAQDSVEARVITDNLNVRSNPGIGFPVRGQYMFNMMVRVEAREDVEGNGGLWVYTRAVDGSLEGWVFSEYLDFPPTFIYTSLPIVEVETVPPAGSGDTSGVAGFSLPAVTNANVNFRSGPGTQYAILDGLTEGVRGTATGRNGSSTWIQVTINGQQGWLYHTLVDVDGDVTALPVTEDTTSPASPGQGSTGSVNTPAPAYSAANLGVFSYGAHVRSFNHIGLMQATGMTWIKMQVRYHPGQDPASVAWMIQNAHANGMRILLGVVGEPRDVANGGENYFQQYAGFVGGVAALGADAIEVWNEPNLDREWPNGQINPATYTRLLALSYNAIKANNPATIVISGAPAPTGAEGLFGRAAVWNDNNFLAGMAGAGAARYMDCLGAHYNEGIVSPSWTSGDPRGGYYTRYFWGMVNTYRSIFPGTPICFTELGYLSPEGYGQLPGAFGWAQDTSVAEHAAWLAEAIRLARSSGSVRLVIIWNLDFTGTYGADPMGGYAIIRPDGSCPACNLLSR
ncbi:MAG: SH3 domain-containing protein [Chloroflexi bacterium]|nr:SH3 domain-containing protein [Chloroflexota bacterium]